MLDLMYITNRPEEANAARCGGAGRIMIDLERLGKHVRQRGRNTYISDHQISDIRLVRERIGNFPLMVRINPIYSESQKEIEQCIAGGADTLMLPMFTDSIEVDRFLKLAGGKVRTCLLLETAPALCRIDDILAIRGIDELYVGINDLSLSMHLDFLFELLSGGIVDYIAQKAVAAGIPFGFGGIARMGEGIIPAELILSEHYRLGSKMVILSRTFRKENDKETIIREEIQKIRAYEVQVSAWNAAQFSKNRKIVHHRVQRYVETLKSQRS